MKIGRLQITASRWPWQEMSNNHQAWKPQEGASTSTRYGWLPHRSKRGGAMLNPNGSRFGGGWNWALGFRMARRSVLIDLLFGSISIAILKSAKAQAEHEAWWKGIQEQARAITEASKSSEGRK